MTQVFFREIDRLKRLLLEQGDQVENQVDRVTEALLKRDMQLVRKIFSDERAIDQRDISLQEECFKILALYQPVALDLRFVVAVLKFNNDLERIADLAASIAKRAKKLVKLDAPPLVYDFAAMAAVARKMLKDAMNALVEVDTELTRGVFADEQILNRLHKENTRAIQSAIQHAPEQVEALIHQLVISRHVERIGDLATNLAEEVVYLAEGEIIRHRDAEEL